MEKKVVIISGGCGLLGTEFAKTLYIYNEGYIVIVLDLFSKVKGYKLDGYEEFGIDITSEYMVQETIKYIYEKYGHIDVAINCAALNPQPKEQEDNFFENYSLKRWKETLDVNLTGSFLLSRECIKYMLKNEKEGFKGNIINIASDLGVITSDNRIYDNGYIKPPCYGVSKAGLIQLTKYLGGYYRDKIKSVCLVPGSVYNGQSDSLKKNLENRIPIGRLARPNEYNEAIKFLCSSGSDYMQGQILVMDGGRGIW